MSESMKKLTKLEQIDWKRHKVHNKLLTIKHDAEFVRREMLGTEFEDDAVLLEHLASKMIFKHVNNFKKED
jgi:hypothetical protein